MTPLLECSVQQTQELEAGCLESSCTVAHLTNLRVAAALNNLAVDLLLHDDCKGALQTLENAISALKPVLQRSDTSADQLGTANGHDFVGCSRKEASGTTQTELETKLQRARSLLKDAKMQYKEAVSMPSRESGSACGVKFLAQSENDLLTVQAALLNEDKDPQDLVVLFPMYFDECTDFEQVDDYDTDWMSTVLLYNLGNAQVAAVAPLFQSTVKQLDTIKESCQENIRTSPSHILQHSLQFFSFANSILTRHEFRCQKANSAYLSDYSYFQARRVMALSLVSKTAVQVMRIVGLNAEAFETARRLENTVRILRQSPLLPEVCGVKPVQVTAGTA